MSDNYLEEQHKQALKRLETHLKKCSCKAIVKLETYQIEKYSERSAVEGWEFYPSYLQGIDYCLRIFVDSSFPFTMPKVAIMPEPPFLQYPHIEQDGYLCLDVDEKPMRDETDIEGATDEIIDSSHKLLYSCIISGDNKIDFQNEIIAYWERSKDTGGIEYFSFLDVHGNSKSREIIVSPYGKNYLLSETEDEANRWLMNATWQNLKEIKKQGHFRGLLLYPKHIFETPNDYPNSTIDVYEFIKTNLECDIVKAFEDMIKSFNVYIFIIIAFKVQDGIALVGLRNKKINKSQDLNKGFRPGKITIEIAIKRAYNRKESYQKLNVKRVDPMWILSRDSDKRIIDLLKRKIIIVGCGAIGSAVAVFLAQAGVGHMRLVDHDSMAWENIGRHVLGANAACKNEEKNKAKNKAKLLEEHISKNFPHIIIESKNCKWENIIEKTPSFFDDSNLVIMATGSWSAENAMNKYSNSKSSFPPIVYGWAEAFACAGHALAVFKSDGCLDCVFDDDDFKFKTTSFEKEISHAPGCGITFQPFSSIELSPIVSIIAETCIDILSDKITSSQILSWIGSKYRVTEKKGKWEDRAIKLFKKYNNDNGCFREILNFDAIERCHICSQKR